MDCLILQLVHIVNTNIFHGILKLLKDSRIFISSNSFNFPTQRHKKKCREYYYLNYRRLVKKKDFSRY